MTPFKGKFRLLAVGNNDKIKSELWLYVEPICNATKQMVQDHKGHLGNHNDRIICALSMSFRAMNKHFSDQGVNITYPSNPNWMRNSGIVKASSEEVIELIINDFKVKYCYPKHSTQGYRRLTFICNI